MEHARIVIVGGGLAGLFAAHRLEQRGVADVLLLEAREDCGGRILTTPGGFDLGATWFWPDLQPELAALIGDLGLAPFAQHEAGALLWERSADRPAQRVDGAVSSPPSMRLMGGMASLVDALRQRIVPERIRTGVRVRKLEAAGSLVDLRGDVASAAGPVVIRAQHVLLAMPPRLAVHSIDFAPGLPPELADRWRRTDTWMAPHAKYLASYAEPFWRPAGLSGAARSSAGPMGEIHDASMPGGGAALFGFVGVPASTRRRVPSDALRALCRAQLVRLYGERAGSPTDESLKDWADDPFTATPEDAREGHEHPTAPEPTPSVGPWAGRLLGIGSEWSPRFAGYAAGALDAAERGVHRLMSSPSWRAESSGDTA